MSIKDWSDDELDTLAKRYKEKGISAGGKYTLAEILMEQSIRESLAFNGHLILKAILDLCRSSPKKKTTYGELYQHLSPGSKWKGNATQGLMSKTLDKAAHYCIIHNLPMITALVVRKTGKLDYSAINNMYTFARDRGVEVGPSADAYIENQILKSLRFVEGYEVLPISPIDHPELSTPE